MSMRVTAAFVRLRDRLRAELTRLRLGGASPPDDWRLVEASDRRTRWRRDDRTLDCRRLGDGYVVTAARDTDRSRFQLTPGAVPLAGALAVASVYLGHGVAPQLNRDGRPFVAVRDGRPRQVYDPDRAGDDVRYVYLDAQTTLDEFPDFLAVRPDVRAAAERMPGGRADRAAAD